VEQELYPVTDHTAIFACDCGTPPRDCTLEIVVQIITFFDIWSIRCPTADPGFLLTPWYAMLYYKWISISCREDDYRSVVRQRQQTLCIGSPLNVDGIGRLPEGF